MSDRWRGVLAALLNPDLRAALAELPQEARLTDARRSRARARLVELGLARETEGAGLAFDDTAVRAILAEAAPTRREGPERYLDGDGRIDRYPVRDADRIELLAWVVARAIGEGEVLTEAEVNERLQPFTDDVAVLRRYLVDAELLERTRSGSSYARVDD